MPQNTDLPPLPAWEAKSFWLTLVGAAAAVATIFGFDLFGLLGAEGEEDLVQKIMVIVAGVSIVLAWIQRLTPHFRLVLRRLTPGERAEAGPATLRSSAWIGALVLAAFALAGCFGVEQSAEPVSPFQAACNRYAQLDAQIDRYSPIAAIWGYDIEALIAERDEVGKILATADVLCLQPEA